MYFTILRLIWPYFEKHLAGRAAEYLQARRERRLAIETDEEIADDVEMAVEEPRRTWRRDLLLITGGLLVGSALGFALAHFFNQDDEGA